MLEKNLLTNQIIDFFWASNLESPKHSKCAFTFDSSRHSKSSLSSTTGFISPNNVAIERFPLLRTVSSFNYPFRSLWLTSGSSKMSWNLFQQGGFSIFQHGFPQNNQFEVFLWSLNLTLLTWVRMFDYKTIEFLALCGIVMNQSWQKVLLVWIHLGIQTYTSSTLLLWFFPTRCQSTA